MKHGERIENAGSGSAGVTWYWMSRKTSLMRAHLGRNRKEAKELPL